VGEVRQGQSAGAPLRRSLRPGGAAVGGGRRAWRGNGTVGAAFSYEITATNYPLAAERQSCPLAERSIPRRGDLEDADHGDSDWGSQRRRDRQWYPHAKTSAACPVLRLPG